MLRPPTFEKPMFCSTSSFTVRFMGCHRDPMSFQIVKIEHLDFGLKQYVMSMTGDESGQRCTLKCRLPNPDTVSHGFQEVQIILLLYTSCVTSFTQDHILQPLNVSMIMSIV